MEVEDVEALGLEHRPDLAQVARRKRQRPDRAVRRHRHADAETDDVALGRSLRSVARREDPDVVAAQPEVLVEVAHVLGNAAGLRVDVRTDEADLHEGPRSASSGPARGSYRG